MANKTEYWTSAPLPNTKLSGLKICPNGPERTESMVPGSRSTRMALGTYFPPAATDSEQQQVFYKVFVFWFDMNDEKNDACSGE